MEFAVSQSLSSRAMSFDSATTASIESASRLNPFRAGRCLSTISRLRTVKRTRLNPFRAGRCLSTRLIK